MYSSRLQFEFVIPLCTLELFDDCLLIQTSCCIFKQEFEDAKTGNQNP